MHAFRVNLLPWRQRRLRRETRHWWLWLLFFTVGLLTTLAVYRGMLTQQRGALDETLHLLQQEKQAYSGQLRKVQQLMEALQQQQWKQQAANKTRAHNRNIEQLLKQLTQTLPDGLWLTAMTVQNGKVNLMGRGHDYADIVRFSSRLETETVLTTVRLIQARQETVPSTASAMPTLTFHLQADWDTDVLSQQAFSHDE